MKRYSLFALLLLSACSASSDVADDAPPQALVTLARAQRSSVSETATLYGLVEIGPEGRDALFTPVEARLVRIESPVGSVVAADDVIVRLEPGPNARLALKQARSDAAAAREAFARAKRLKAGGLASDADVDTARAAAASVEALLASLSRRSAKLVLRALAPAVVESVGARPGDLIPAGTAVVSLIRQEAGTRIRFGVDPALARRLDTDADVSVRVSGDDSPFAVPISSIDPVVDSTTRLASVYATVPPNAALTPGETVTGRVAVRASDDALVVPYDALLDDGGQPFVYVVADGVAHRHDVRTGATDGKTVAIERGLEDGDQVVIEGGTALEDGMKVRLN